MLIADMTQEVYALADAKLCGTLQAVPHLDFVQVARLADHDEVHRRQGVAEPGHGLNQQRHPFVRRHPADVQQQGRLAKLQQVAQMAARRSGPELLGVDRMSKHPNSIRGKARLLLKFIGREAAMR